MRFNSSKSLLLKILIPIIFLTLTYAVIKLFTQSNLSIVSVIFGLTIIISSAILLASIYFRTYYEIKNGLVYYRSGPFFGKIDILIIREIELNKTMYVGFKPTLDSGGVILRYNKWEDIYFSPENANQFIAELIIINPLIEVKYNQ